MLQAWSSGRRSRWRLRVVAASRAAATYGQLASITIIGRIITPCIGLVWPARRRPLHDAHFMLEDDRVMRLTRRWLIDAGRLQLHARAVVRLSLPRVEEAVAAARRGSEAEATHLARVVLLPQGVSSFHVLPDAGRVLVFVQDPKEGGDRWRAAWELPWE